jgi:uncharacterized repeat protein (TIGR01451 family)
MSGAWLRALARVGRERRINSAASARWHAVLLVAAAASASASSPPPLSPPDFPLLSEGSVTSIARLPGGDLVTAGSFISINGIARDDIARFADDGTLLDPGATESLTEDPRVVAVDAAGDFYVAGGLEGTPTCLVQKFDGATGLAASGWSCSTADSTAYALALGADGAVYVGGAFTTVNGVARHRLARLDGATGSLDASWNPNADEAVFALVADSSGAIYAGGDFATIGGQARSHIAKLAGTGTGAADATWNPAADNTVYTLARDASTSLYAGGAFTAIGGQSRGRIAMLATSGTGAADATWDPSADGDVRVIALDSAGAVYAGGDFQTIGGGAHERLVKLSPTGTGAAVASWNASASDFVYALTFDADDNLYVGGEFARIDGATRLAFARLAPDGSLAAGFQNDAEMGGFAFAFAVQPDGGTIVGGNFRKAGQDVRWNLLRLKPDRTLDPGWAPVADDEIDALLAAPDGSVYVGGLFLTLNGVARDRIARLGAGGAVDPNWNPAPSAQVSELARGSDGSIYAAGGFTSIGGVPRSGIAKLAPGGTGAVDASWNPTLDGIVRAVAIGNDGSVYIGGDFMHAGGLARTRLAKLSGTTGATDPSWNPSADSFVYSLLLGNGTVYAGGAFTTIGGQTRPSIARLDAGGSGAADASWNAQASGSVYALGIDAAGDVYAGGSYGMIGGQPASGLARLSGSSGAADPNWIPAVNGFVIALDVGADQAIDVGGGFDKIAGAPRIGFALMPPVAVPIAVPDTYELYEDTPLTVTAANGVLANDSDSGGNPLTIVNTGAQTATGIGGTVALNADGSFSYAPPPNANGTAGFTYVVSDGFDTATGTVTLTVDPVNDPPTFSLAQNPGFAPGTTGQLTVPNFATMTSPGPPDEHDNVLAWHVRTVSDPDGILGGPVTIATDGTLSAMLTGNGGVAELAVALQDDGGTAHGGNDTSPEQTFFISAGVGADLSIAIDDGTSFVEGGDAIGYVVTVRNAGPQTASGAHVSVALSSNLVDATWTCEASAGASCAAAGSGEIHDVATIPMNASIVYTLTATVLAVPELPTEADATVAPPGGTVDYDPNNDSASDVNAVGIFHDGFDTTEAAREEKAATAARTQ